MARGITPTFYRVCWPNGNDAILDEWGPALKAVVLDTALEHAVKVAKKWKDLAIVWEYAADGTSVRAFGTTQGLRWPEPHPCKDCKGVGKVSTGFYSMTPCSKCKGCGRVPEV
jgi:hypothetical protein